MKKWYLYLVALLLVASSAQAQQPINIGKALVRVASPGELMMPGMAMPSLELAVTETKLKGE